MTSLLPWHGSAWDLLQEARALGRLAHAILLAGPVGLGKSQFARLFASSLLCTSLNEAAEPCGNCRNCQLFRAGNHPDIKEIIPEERGKQLKVDAIRTLVTQSVLTVEARSYRVFLLDPADAMNRAAANSLLKTLEEPIPRTLLVLISSHPERLPATIKSRCQMVRIGRPPTAMALDWLTAQAALERDAAATLLKVAKGAPLLALELARSGEMESYSAALKEFIALANGESEPAAIAGKWEKEQQIETLLQRLADWTSDIIRYKYVPGEPVIEESISTGGLKRLAEQLDLRALYGFMDTLYEIEYKRGNNLNPLLSLERILVHWNRINTRGVI